MLYAQCPTLISAKQPSEVHRSTPAHPSVLCGLLSGISSVNRWSRVRDPEDQRAFSLRSLESQCSTLNALRWL